jgi:hypothetical protein
MDGLTFSCPVCGADVPRKAKSCPECGACEKSGWSQDRYLDGLDLPEESFHQGRSLGGEFDGGAKPSRKQRLWLVVAVILLIAMLWLTLRSAW